MRISLRAVTAVASLAALSACGVVATPGAPTSGPASTRSAKAVLVTIADFSFDPGRITVTSGTTVRWQNHDSVGHTVTADDRSFGSPVLRRGRTWAHVFKKPGKYRYHCAIHPYMVGEVTVTK